MDYGTGDPGDVDNTPTSKKVRPGKTTDRDYNDGKADTTEDEILSAEDTDVIERKQPTVKGRVNPSPRKTRN